MGSKKDIKEFNPFPGLRPFAPEDSDLFFGREAESNEVISKLSKNSYITVLGASGNGKSSIVFSGVLPKILSSQTGDSSVLRTYSFSPGNDPFGNLATTLSIGITDTGQKSTNRDEVLNELIKNDINLSDVVKKFLPGSNNKVLFILDQFEELFRYSASVKPEISTETTRKFVDLLLNTVDKKDPNVLLIITMRSEYIGECTHYKGLTTLVNNSNYLLPEMTPDNLKDVIEGPLNLTGVKIDPELVEVLLADVSNHSYKLPVLQHALRKSWEHWKKSGQPELPLGMIDYEKIGTINNAVSLHADEIYNDLNQISKDICAASFKVITRKDSDNKSSRNPSDIETIRSIAGCSAEEVISVLNKFRQSDFSFILPAGDVTLSKNSIIDLRSEYLIRLWSRLKDWVDDEAASRDIYLRLSEASALYQQGKAGLLRSPDLEPVILWRNKIKPTLAWAVQYNPAFERAIVYLRTSEKSYLIEEQNKIILQTKKIRRNRLINRILGVAVLVAAAFMLFIYVQKQTAVRNITLAEKKMREAERGKAIADSFAGVVLKQKIISDSTTSLSVREAEEARQLRAAADIQKSLAERKTITALYQKNLALHQSDSFKAVSLKADENTKIAITQRNETQRLRMLAIGKSMSLKSLQMDGQKDLQPLLAYQAYLFNKKNNGPENDPDIFAGLYNVGKNYNSINYQSFQGHTGEIKSIAFLPGKNEFFTSGNDGKVLRWSLEKKDQTLQVLYSGNDVIEVLAVSPDASWLACGSSNSSIKMIPLKGTAGGYEMNGHKGSIRSLIFSYDGKYLYSAALDGKVLKWDIAARTSVNVNTGANEISSIDISSRGNYIAGLSKDGKVIVWNQEQKSDNFRIETTGKNVNVVRFSPDNNLLAIGDAEGTIELWDINLRKKLSEVKAHNGQVSDIQFNTSLKQMATSGNDKKLMIFNIKDPADLTEPPVTFADNEGFVLVMKFSPDGQIIVSGESGGGSNVISRPTHVDYLVQNICNIVNRNMTQDEWNLYVARDIPLEKTCPAYNYNIIIEPIKSLTK